MLSIFFLSIAACQSGTVDKDAVADSLAVRESVPPSPVVPPGESIAKMKVEEGFEVQLIAAEPLVNSPVAMVFDADARMWVVEMNGYMPDTMGTGEDQPTGKVVILTDTDKDGRADERKVFMDSLVLPRAICLIEDGILIAEPPNLWYVKIRDDKPGKKELVDNKYTEGGNVEHQPNGLFRALDNWIYNAESHKRYRKAGSKWLIEKTHNRGQWGISQDDYGRLHYNNNSENLLADYFSPGLGAANENQRRVAGFSERVVPGNRVFPLRPTPGVNRGYMQGVLDDSLRLVKFTAASGPVLYRGDLFGKAYYGNAFVGEPSANLIKRNIIFHEGYRIRGKQAYEGKEFLSSTDERFRPVTLYNGPDGALYVLDMYRGVIQHKTYLTGYLKSEINSRKLSEPTTCGRLYKVVPENKQVNFRSMPRNPEQLTMLLDDANGWVRDKAQQMIIDGHSLTVVPALRKWLLQKDRILPVIHSLWTLEGLQALRPEDVLPLLKHEEWLLRMQALSVLPSVTNKETYGRYLPVLQQMVDEHDTLAVPYVAFLVYTIQAYDKPAAEGLVKSILRQYADNTFISDAVISTMQGREAVMLRQISALNPDTSLAVNKRLQKVLTDIDNRKNSSNMKNLVKEYPVGAALFKSVCQACHGADGNGIRSLAPPLNKSDIVVGDKNRLLAIVLFGLTGPVTVSGTVYEAPEINGDMPGIGHNAEISDADIAQVVSFIRNAWNNKAEKVNAGEVGKIRKKYKGRQKAFTMQELSKSK